MNEFYFTKKLRISLSQSLITYNLVFMRVKTDLEIIAEASALSTKLFLCLSLTQN